MKDEFVSLLRLSGIFNCQSRSALIDLAVVPRAFLMSMRLASQWLTNRILFIPSPMRMRTASALVSAFHFFFSPGMEMKGFEQPGHFSPQRKHVPSLIFLAFFADGFFASLFARDFLDGLTDGDANTEVALANLVSSIGIQIGHLNLLSSGVDDEYLTAS